MLVGWSSPNDPRKFSTLAVTKILGPFSSLPNLTMKVHTVAPMGRQTKKTTTKVILIPALLPVMICNGNDSSLVCCVSTWKSTTRTWSLISAQSATKLFHMLHTWQSTCQCMTLLERNVAMHVNTAISRSYVHLACVNTPRRSIWRGQSRMFARTATVATSINVHWRVICAGIQHSDLSLARLVELALNISPTFRNT